MGTKPPLETSRLIFRPLVVQDSLELFRTTGDSAVMRYWIGGADQAIHQTAQRIIEFNEHWKKHGFGDWGIVEKTTGKIIGFGGVHYISKMEEVNFGYALSQDKWRQGFGFEHLQLSSIVAVIWPENSASINLIKKLGFEFRKEFMWQGSVRVVYGQYRDRWIRLPEYMDNSRG